MFRASEYAFSLSFARQVSEQFRVGINGKIIQSYLYDREIGTSSFAVDVGTLYDIPILKSHIGVSLTNIGQDLKYVNETYSLPTALRFGVLVDVMKDASSQFITTFQISRLNADGLGGVVANQIQPPELFSNEGERTWLPRLRNGFGACCFSAKRTRATKSPKHPGCERPLTLPGRLEA